MLNLVPSFFTAFQSFQENLFYKAGNLLLTTAMAAATTKIWEMTSSWIAYYYAQNHIFLWAFSASIGITVSLYFLFLTYELFQYTLQDLSLIEPPPLRRHPLLYTLFTKDDCYELNFFDSLKNPNKYNLQKGEI